MNAFYYNCRFLLCLLHICSFKFVNLTIVLIVLIKVIYKGIFQYCCCCMSYILRLIFLLCHNNSACVVGSFYICYGMAPKRKSTKKIATAKKIKKTASSPEEITEVSSMQLPKISTQLVPSLKRCTQAFFNQPCVDLAKSLLGKIIVRHINYGNTVCSTLIICKSCMQTYRLCARIVEMEAYPGGEDMASYSYNGRRTKGNEGM